MFIAKFFNHVLGLSFELMDKKEADMIRFYEKHSVDLQQEVLYYENYFIWKKGRQEALEFYDNIIEKDESLVKEDIVLDFISDYRSTFTSRQDFRDLFNRLKEFLKPSLKDKHKPFDLKLVRVIKKALNVKSFLFVRNEEFVAKTNEFIGLVDVMIKNDGVKSFTAKEFITWLIDIIMSHKLEEIDNLDTSKLEKLISAGEARRRETGQAL